LKFAQCLLTTLVFVSFGHVSPSIEKRFFVLLFCCKKEFCIINSVRTYITRNASVGQVQLSYDFIDSFVKTGFGFNHETGFGSLLQMDWTVCLLEPSR